MLPGNGIFIFNGRDDSMEYDLVVIGSGPGGYVASIRAAQLGARVACVEARDLGGTCLNRGCIPTKALTRSAHLAMDLAQAQELGFQVQGFKVDLPQVMKRKDAVVKNLVGGVEKLFSSWGVELYRGRASLTDPNQVSIVSGEDKGKTLSARYLLLATGSSPALPPVPEEELKHTLSSDEALALTRVPDKMVIIGGGVLAVEFACIYQAFGSKVEMIKRSPLILPPVDPELARRLMILLKRRGIPIHTGIYLEKIRPGEVLARDKKGAEVTFQGDAILVAMGRKPDLGGLPLHSLGITCREGGIAVDPFLETNVKGIYAIGDVLGQHYLASVASKEGICVAENLFANGEKKAMDYSVIPQCVFSHPEVAGVGLTEKEAQKKGLDVVVSKFPLSASGKAVAMGETDGVVKLVAEKEGGRLIGAHILGPQATDLIHQAAVAIKTHATAGQLLEIIFGHPTLSESIMEAAEGLFGGAIHLMPRGKR